MKEENGFEVLSEEQIDEMNEKLKSAENIELPQKLKPENIKKVLDEKANDGGKSENIKAISPRKRKNRRILRAIAACAACAVAVTSLAVARPWDKIPPQVKNSTPIEKPKTVEDYSEIETMFASYSENYRKNRDNSDFVAGIFDAVGGFSKDTAEIYDEAVNGSMADSSTGTSANTSDKQRGDTASDADYGKTNVRTQGVAESDIIKNDGKYIYVVSPTEFKGDTKISDVTETTKVSSEVSVNDSGTLREVSDVYEPFDVFINNTVTVVEPQKDGKLKTVSEIKTDDIKSLPESYYDISEIFVVGDRLIVLLEREELYWFDGVAQDDTEETKASDNTADYGQLTLAISYDISDRKNPKEEWRVYQNGDYISSRLIGDELVLISQYYVDITEDEDTVRNNCVPRICADGEEFGRISGSDICIMEEVNDSSYLVVSVLDVKDKDTLKTKAVLGGGGNVYCTTQTLYVTSTEYATQYYASADTIFNGASANNTQIYKFDISNNDIKFLKCAKISGTALNEFSIDEYNGNLRIATTSGDWGENLVNQVYVLDSELKTLSVLKNIAKGERIKSVRFTGDTAYVVTFEQTDPLFVIDLSDPSAPQILGKLEIPGYSAYLHSVGDGLVMGIGVDGDENGENGGFKVSLFDVSDPKKPQECAKFTISALRGTTENVWLDSNAYYDHRAVCWDSENKTMYIPYMKSENVWASTDGKNYSQYTNGVVALKVDSENKTLKSVGNYIDGQSDDESYLDFVRVTYTGNTVIALSSGNDTALCSFDKTTQKQIDRVVVSSVAE